MLLELKVETVEKLLLGKHDDIWWPDLPNPKCMRGAHIQEIQDIFLLYGKCLYPIERFPHLSPSLDDRLAKRVASVEICEQRYYSRIYKREGILILDRHAVVFDCDNKVFDPNGTISKIENYWQHSHEAWLVGNSY
jgi:hypothetical protein